MATICGISCEACSFKAKCKGCAETCGRPWGGRCIAAEYIKAGGKERYEPTRKRWTEKGVPVFESLDDALAAFRPDLAVIGVPNTRKNRFDNERRLLDAGVPILEYKLRINRFEELDEFAREVDERHGAVFIGEPYLYLDCVRVLRRELAQWGMGRPEYVRWQCSPDGGTAPWMRAYRHLALDDLAQHHFSVMDSLFGLSGANVTAYSLSPKKGGFVTGSVCGEYLTLPGGLTVNHDIDWIHGLRRTDWLGTICIECEQGGVLVENGRITVTRWGEEACTMPCAPEPLNPLEDMLNHLCGAPSEGIRTLREYMSVMEALDRAARSAEAR